MDTSKVEYEIKGLKLDIEDMRKIDIYYQIVCTAEFLMENYKEITNFDLALAVGYEVRELMRRYEYDELYAIDYALNRRR